MILTGRQIPIYTGAGENITLGSGNDQGFDKLGGAFGEPGDVVLLWQKKARSLVNRKRPEKLLTYDPGNGNRREQGGGRTGGGGGGSRGGGR